MKVVIDTNVVVSANLSDEGPSAAILDLAASTIILMCISPAVFVGYEDALRRPRLKLEPFRIASGVPVELTAVPWSFDLEIGDVPFAGRLRRVRRCAPPAPSQTRAVPHCLWSPRGTYRSAVVIRS